VYSSCWMKCRYPDVFVAAMLNAQPLGFYAPAQLVRDAREHGVEVREVDVNLSDWDCTLEPLGGAPPLPPYGERAGGRGAGSQPSSGPRGRVSDGPSFAGLRRPLPPGGEGTPPSPGGRGLGGGGIHPRHAEMAPHIRTTHAVRLGFRQIVGVKEKDI